MTAVKQRQVSPTPVITGYRPVTVLSSLANLLAELIVTRSAVIGFVISMEGEVDRYRSRSLRHSVMLYINHTAIVHLSFAFVEGTSLAILVSLAKSSCSASTPVHWQHERLAVVALTFLTFFTSSSMSTHENSSFSQSYGIGRCIRTINGIYLTASAT